MLLVLLLVSSLGNAAHFNLNLIPDGFLPGRDGAPYGSYSTPFSESARHYGELLDKLEVKAYGLSMLADDDEVDQAELVFYMEFLSLSVHQLISDAGNHVMTPFERGALLFKSARIYGDIRQHGERLYESMIRKVDIALPGANGAQLRSEIPNSIDALYEANHRSETPLTDPERKAIYDKKLAEFYGSGGKPTDLYPLTQEKMAQFGKVARVEYVIRPNNELWVTEGTAGHVLLAGGEKVLAAGQIVFVKDAAGKLSLVILSNASGNYKPDLYSVELLAQRLQTEYEVAEDRFVVTKGEPLGVQTVKILLKAAKEDSAKVKARISEMEKEAKEISKSPEPYFLFPKVHTNCATALAG